ncbi:MAG: 3-phosphoglycerate dehydrogenase [Bacteroidetes bacterium]|nr:MAG: 3-phosphoglycerate dehydrogenase [Bacteroidota bacterium]
MIRILVNDGIHPDGKLLLEDAGFEVVTDKIAQEDLPRELPKFDAIIVRSATKVRKDLIDQCPNLKVIARGGVGLDNIDVEYAQSKGITVMNTPAASSQSVAELAFAHMFTLARFLHQSNRDMPQKGDTDFKNLKKAYSKGMQLRGKTLGIVGFGRIGQETARIGLGLGMTVMPVDLVINRAEIGINVYKSSDVSMKVRVETVKMDEMLAKADFISLHVPGGSKPLIGREEFAKMKDGVIVINTARGGTIDEEALLEAIESGKVAGAGLDVFENEPTPRKALLNHNRISVTPHIGASTNEAQRNIGLELADKIIAFFSES